jgi:hypothetical protein
MEVGFVKFECYGTAYCLSVVELAAPDFHAGLNGVGQGADDFIKLNSGQMGLYSVSYDTPLWDRLVAAARRLGGDGKPVLPGSDLAGLLRDSFFQATNRLTPITVFLKLLNASSPSLPFLLSTRVH